jgi:hypothetical protein
MLNPDYVIFHNLITKENIEEISKLTRRGLKIIGFSEKDSLVLENYINKHNHEFTFFYPIEEKI